MAGMSRDQLTRITNEVRFGNLLPEVAIEKITSDGTYLAIGAAASKEEHHPAPALRAHTEDIDEAYWTYVLKNAENDGTTSVLRAGTMASTAIHAALGGDINIQNERLHTGTLLTPPGRSYPGGTYGWEFDKKTGAYVLLIHKDLRANIDPSDNEDDLLKYKPIGVVDFVRREKFDISIPEEPGHYASTSVHRRMGSISINLATIRRNLQRSDVRELEYEPSIVPPYSAA